MSHLELLCHNCGARHDAEMGTLGCRDCDGPLDVVYRAVGPGIRQPKSWPVPDIPLPIHEQSSLVSLEEGGTPCVELAALGRELGLRSLLGKLELLNPTASFKDRGTSVMVSVARELGVSELVEDSSGNAGASVAAYAARAGIKAHVFAPASAPAAKLKQIAAYGAELHLIEGARESTTAAARAFHEERRLVYASHALSPYFLEGTKTFAYEVWQQLNGDIPDHIVFPVGNGGLFLGALKGFRELLAAGRTERVPRLHTVQARSVMPIVSAFTSEGWSSESAGSTVAGGIEVAAPPRLGQVLDALRETNGEAVAVEDGQVLRFQRTLAEKEGIFAEPTSAAAFAGLSVLLGQGKIEGDEAVLVPVTGSGLKDQTSV